MKYIIHADTCDGEHILALRCARWLHEEGHDECVYEFENNSAFHAKRNKESITVRKCGGFKNE